MDPHPALAQHGQQDLPRARQNPDELARRSGQAQSRPRPADGMHYALKSAVILRHIQPSALRNRID